LILAKRPRSDNDNGEDLTYWLGSNKLSVCMQECKLASLIQQNVKAILF
jgi:hypothetical protein